MTPTTRKQHEKIFYQCMRFIEKPECNYGSGEICDILLFNQIDKIINIINLDNDNIKAIHKIISNTNNRIHLTMTQRNSIKIRQYFNAK